MTYRQELPAWDRVSVDFPYPFGGFDDEGTAWIGLGGVASTPVPLFPQISQGIREVVSESAQESGADLAVDGATSERYELGPAAQSVFGEVVTAWESIKPLLENIDLLLSSAGWLVAAREKYRRWQIDRKQETRTSARVEGSREAIDFYYPEAEVRLSPTSAVLLCLSDAVERHEVAGEGKATIHFSESPQRVFLGDPLPWNRYIVHIQSRQHMLYYMLDNQSACNEHFQSEQSRIMQLPLPKFHNPYSRSLAPSWDDVFRIGEYSFDF